MIEAKVSLYLIFVVTVILAATGTLSLLIGIVVAVWAVWCLTICDNESAAAESDPSENS